MRGVILAGGLGTRLSPLTRVTNKHLLPVWDRPMIYYPIENMVKAGIDEVLIVTGGNYAGHFLNLLHNGKEFGLKRLAYAYQEGEGGIADALRLAQDFVEDDNFCVMLGDNIYGKHIGPYLKKFETVRNNGFGAMVLTVDVSSLEDCKRFGVAFRRRKGDQSLDWFVPYEIIEKPKDEQLQNFVEKGLTPAIVTGTYFYTPEVFDYVRSLKPSARGELEITDVNQRYSEQARLVAQMIPCWWSDAGTFESLHSAATQVINQGANQ